jgi:3-phosphoinositide dependent protein kinase-1
LLDFNHHIKLADFGTAKDLTAPPSEVRSFVGTAQYCPPELLKSQPHTSSSDFWALGSFIQTPKFRIGCVVFYLTCGRQAFVAQSDYMIFQAILALEYVFPPGFDEEARKFVEGALVIDVAGRLGLDEMKRLSMFEWVKDWEGLGLEDAPRAEREGDEEKEGGGSDVEFEFSSFADGGEEGVE